MDIKDLKVTEERFIKIVTDDYYKEMARFIAEIIIGIVLAVLICIGFKDLKRDDLLYAVIIILPMIGMMIMGIYGLYKSQKIRKLYFSGKVSVSKDIKKKIKNNRK